MFGLSIDECFVYYEARETNETAFAKERSGLFIPQVRGGREVRVDLEFL